MNGLSVVLPTYNEAPNIVPLLRALQTELAGRACEVIVVDDDSPDGTWRLAEAEATISSGIRVIRRIGRRGLTSAIAEGIQASHGEFIGWMDCDFTVPPSLISRLAAKVEEGFDIALAARYVPGSRDGRSDAPLRKLASRVIVEFARALLPREFHDYTNGVAVARRAGKLAEADQIRQHLVGFGVRGLVDPLDRRLLVGNDRLFHQLGLSTKAHVIIEVQHIEPSKDIRAGWTELFKVAVKVFSRFQISRAALFLIRPPLGDFPGESAGSWNVPSPSAGSLHRPCPRLAVF